MGDVTLVGIDRGKHSFHLHGQDAKGKAVFRKKLSRKPLIEFFATFHACTVIMEAYDSPSLILDYSHCIAHGIDMRLGMKQQDLAVASGFWPLLRFNPALRAVGKNPFRLDSPRPAIPLKDYAYNEIRYSGLMQTDPDEARVLLDTAQRDVAAKYLGYEALSELDGAYFHSKVNSAPSRRLP
jgi:hypothetical protein